jgi:hypothetical protein
MSKMSNNMTATAGEYFVCAELGRQNILALLTPKNNPLFDVVASTPDGRKSVAIQVKTSGIGNKQGWKLGRDLESRKRNPSLFVILVDMKGGTNDYFIFPYDDLADRIKGLYKKYIRTPKRDGGARKEVGFRWFDLRQFSRADRARKNNWGLLGLS